MDTDLVDTNCLFGWNERHVSLSSRDRRLPEKKGVEASIALSSVREVGGFVVVRVIDHS